MKWYHTKYKTKCIHCHEPIEPGDMNYASSTAVFCEECGNLKEKGDLVYSKKQQQYILVDDNLDNI